MLMIGLSGVPRMWESWVTPFRDGFYKEEPGSLGKRSDSQVSLYAVSIQVIDIFRQPRGLSDVVDGGRRGGKMCRGWSKQAMISKMIAVSGKNLRFIYHLLLPSRLHFNWGAQAIRSIAQHHDY